MCGFSDVRKDKHGYYCSKCGKRLEKDFRQKVSLFCGKEIVKQLDGQCC